MRAAVAEPDKRVRTVEHGAAGLKVPIREVRKRGEQEPPAGVGQHQVQGDVQDGPSHRPRHRRQRAFWGRLVVGWIPKREDAVEVAEAPNGVRRAANGLFRHHLRAELRLPERGDLGGERQGGERAKGWVGREWVQAGLQTQQRADGPRRHLALYGQAAIGSVCDQVQQRFPRGRVMVHLGERESDRPRKSPRQTAHHVEFGIGTWGVEIRDHFEHAGRGVIQPLENSRQFRLRRAQRGRRIASLGSMIEGSGGGETQCARLHRFTGETPHLGDIVVGGDFQARAAFAHDEDA